MPKHICELFQDKEYIIIADGARFLIKDENDSFPRGHAGNVFLFRLKDSGDVIYSSNVWHIEETNEPETAEIIDYVEWGKYGIGPNGELTDQADVYVYDDSLFVMS